MFYPRKDCLVNILIPFCDLYYILIITWSLLVGLFDAVVTHMCRSRVTEQPTPTLQQQSVPAHQPCPASDNIVTTCDNMVIIW